MELNLAIFIGGILFSIVGYFIKRLIDDLKCVSLQTVSIRTELDVLKSEHKIRYDNLAEKFDELKLSIMSLTLEIKELNKNNR